MCAERDTSGWGGFFSCLKMFRYPEEKTSVYVRRCPVRCLRGVFFFLFCLQGEVCKRGLGSSYNYFCTLFLDFFCFFFYPPHFPSPVSLNLFFVLLFSGVFDWVMIFL